MTPGGQSHIEMLRGRSDEFVAASFLAAAERREADRSGRTEAELLALRADLRRVAQDAPGDDLDEAKFWAVTARAAFALSSGLSAAVGAAWGIHVVQAAGMTQSAAGFVFLGALQLASGKWKAVTRRNLHTYNEVTAQHEREQARLEARIRHLEAAENEQRHEALGGVSASDQMIAAAQVLGERYPGVPAHLMVSRVLASSTAPTDMTLDLGV